MSSYNAPNQNLKHFPEYIRHMPYIERLNLSGNKISMIPSWINELTELKELILNNNRISVIPEEVCTPILENLCISNNHISNIPEYIGKCINLHNLSISNNMISNMDSLINCTNLRYLCIADNDITFIPNDIDKLTELQELMILNNELLSIPISITRCMHLKILYFSGNKNMIISPQIARLVYRLKHKRIGLHIYDDSQSVHIPFIQDSISKSIENIMNQPIDITNMDSILDDIMSDTTIDIDCKEQLKQYIMCQEIHMKLNVNFKELLCYIWKTIEMLEYKDEIKKILCNEIKESRDKCFTGRLSSLVNCLNGFTSLVEINISEEIQISNVISVIYSKMAQDGTLSNSMLFKETIKKELEERGYSESLILLWINNID